MSHYIGIDIGGTKIAAALFDPHFREVARHVSATPTSYDELLQTCRTLVAQLDALCGGTVAAGIGIPGGTDHDSGLVYHAANTPALVGQQLGKDLAAALARRVIIANDADCAALSEAVLGAGQGRRSVFGLIMGTGVGGGFVMNGRLAAGTHGLAGEIGHLPLPFRTADDGPTVLCSCGQHGCIDKTISGPGLARLYDSMTGQTCDPHQIVAKVQNGDMQAQAVLDRFLITVAKAFVTIIHSYDPDMIVVSGGLNTLPGLYEKMPDLLSDYTVVKTLRVPIVPAMHGAMSGLRGAALLTRD